MGGDLASDAEVSDSRAHGGYIYSVSLGLNPAASVPDPNPSEHVGGSRAE